MSREARQQELNDALAEREAKAAAQAVDRARRDDFVKAALAGMLANSANGGSVSLWHAQKAIEIADQTIRLLDIREGV